MAFPTVNLNRSRAAKRANRQGSNLENIAMLSKRDILELFRLPKCGGRFVGPKKMIHEKMPCDLLGTVTATGRAFFADCKRCEDKYGIDFGDEKILKAHQRDFLADMHSAGAISGVLVECVELGRYLWRPGHRLLIPPWTWTSQEWVDLGPTTSLVEFCRLL